MCTELMRGQNLKLQHDHTICHVTEILCQGVAYHIIAYHHYEQLCVFTTNLHLRILESAVVNRMPTINAYLQSIITHKKVLLDWVNLQFAHLIQDPLMIHLLWFSFSLGVFLCYFSVTLSALLLLSQHHNFCVVCPWLGLVYRSLP